VNYRFNLAVQSNNLITLSLDTLDSAANSFAFITNTTLIRDGALGGVGFTALDYNTVSINWELVSNVDFPGDNSIIVNNLEVITTSVPEPGTWAVGALLLAAVAHRIRRRRSSETKA
jgi:MYXO-CTERM domain-containing protein